MGKDAYSLLLRTLTCNKLSFLKQKSHRVTFDNAVIWGAVIAGTIGIGSLTLVPILLAAATVSLVATYRLFDETERRCL